MSGYFILAVVLIALAVAYQIYISRRVARIPDYTDQQRLLQLIMIWGLPVIGASLCHFMLSGAEAADSIEANTDDHSGDHNVASDAGADAGDD